MRKHKRVAHTMNKAYVTGSLGMTPALVERALALGTAVSVADPSGGSVTVFPSVVVMSTAVATVVIADDSGQATLAQVQSAQSAAVTAEQTAQTNATALHAAATADLTTSIAFLSTAVPSQAAVNAQLVVLTKQVNALTRLVIGLLDSTGGTNGPLQ